MNIKLKLNNKLKELKQLFKCQNKNKNNKLLYLKINLKLISFVRKGLLLF